MHHPARHRHQALAPIALAIALAALAAPVQARDCWKYDPSTAERYRDPAAGTGQGFGHGAVNTSCHVNATGYGYGNNASGQGSAAFGHENTARTDWSAAIGRQNAAEGLESASF